MTAFRVPLWFSMSRRTLCRLASTSSLGLGVGLGSDASDAVFRRSPNQVLLLRAELKVRIHNARLHLHTFTALQ